MRSRGDGDGGSYYISWWCQCCDSNTKDSLRRQKHRQRQLIELYDQGIEKLHDEMDFEHTLDRLREIDIFIRGGLFDEKTKFMI